MAARRSLKIMVTSPELEDTVLVATEGDNSRLSTKESFGKISLNPASEEGLSNKTTIPLAKPSKKPAESSEDSAITRFPRKRNEKVKISGETASNSETSDVEEHIVLLKRNNNVNETVTVPKPLALKTSRFRPLFLASEDDNSETDMSDISIDGDEIIPAEMLQTWENDSTFSQSDDEDDPNDVQL